MPRGGGSVVADNVELTTGISRHYMVHKVDELNPPASSVKAADHLASGDLVRRIM